MTVTSCTHEERCKPTRVCNCRGRARGFHILPLDSSTAIWWRHMMGNDLQKWLLACSLFSTKLNNFKSYYTWKYHYQNCLIHITYTHDILDLRWTFLYQIGLGRLRYSQLLTLAKHLPLKKVNLKKTLDKCLTFFHSWAQNLIYDNWKWVLSWLPPHTVQVPPLYFDHAHRNDIQCFTTTPMISENIGIFNNSYQ